MAVRSENLTRMRAANAAAQKRLLMRGRSARNPLSPQTETKGGVNWAQMPTKKAMVVGHQFTRATCPTCGPETLHKTGKCCHCGAVIARGTWLSVDQWVRSKGGKQRAVREV